MIFVSDEDAKSVRERGEEILGEFAQVLLENPLFNQALTTAFEARERAGEAQRSAMGALDISSASEVERLGRRLRSLSDRLEAVEDSLDSLTRDLSVLREQEGSKSTGVKSTGTGIGTKSIGTKAADSKSPGKTRNKSTGTKSTGATGTKPAGTKSRGKSKGNESKGED